MAPDSAVESLPPPVFLCGFPKSGTTLLTSLLDGHPDLLVFPVEARLFRTLENSEPENWLDYTLEWSGVRKLVDLSTYPDDVAAPFRDVDQERFRAVVSARWEASRRTPRDLLESCVTSYAEIEGLATDRPWVEKSPEQEYALPRLAEWWPGLRVIYIVRDPRSAFAAFRAKRRKRGDDLLLERFVARWSRSVRCAERHAADNPTHVVRFEDLTGDPRPTLAAVCEFLGIAWTDTLLEPTIRGRSWAGNSMFGDQHTGISTAPAERWREQLEPTDVRFLEAWLGPVMRRLGYTPELTSSGFAARAREILRGGDRGIRVKAQMIRALLSD